MVRITATYTRYAEEYVAILDEEEVKFVFKDQKFSSFPSLLRAMLKVSALGQRQLDNLVFKLEREDFRKSIAITHKEASQFTDFKEKKGSDKIKALVNILKQLKPQQVTDTNLQRETEEMSNEISSNIEDKMIEEISRQIETMSLKGKYKLMKNIVEMLL